MAKKDLKMIFFLTRNDEAPPTDVQLDWADPDILPSGIVDVAPDDFADVDVGVVVDAVLFGRFVFGQKFKISSILLWISALR